MGRDGLRAGVRSQGRGSDHRAVGLLTVLEHRDERPAYGQTRAVQRVRELVLPAALGTIPNLRPPRLEGLRVAAGRDLAIRLLTWQPHLEIVGLRRRKAHIPCTEQHAPVRQTQAFENRLGVTGQPFEFFMRLFGGRDLHELDLVELVLANEAPHVGTVGPCLASETWRIGRVLQG